MIFRNMESLERRNGPLFEGETPFSGCGYKQHGDGTVEVFEVQEGRELGPYIDKVLHTKDVSLPWVELDALEEDGESTIYYFRGELYTGYTLDPRSGEVNCLLKGGVKEYVYYRDNGSIAELEVPLRKDGDQLYMFSPEGRIERFALYWERGNGRTRRIKLSVPQAISSGTYSGLSLLAERASLSDVGSLEDELFIPYGTLKAAVEDAIGKAKCCENISLSGDGITQEMLQRVFSGTSMPLLKHLSLSSLNWAMVSTAFFKGCPSLRNCDLLEVRPEFKQECKEFAATLAKDLKEHSPNAKVYCFGKRVEG